MTGSVQPYCNGAGCPLKLSCARYKINIDFKLETHLAYAPYSHIENKCGFFVGDPLQKFIDNIKNLKDGDKL